MPNTNSNTTLVLSSTRSMCYCCFDTLIDKLQNDNGNKGNKIRNNNGSDNRNSRRKFFVKEDTLCPIFVTWEINKKSPSASSSSYQLRGCIGSLKPRLLVSAVEEYAMISAFRDRRFNQINISEVPLLRVSVSLLVKYEECKDVYDWTVGVHGIIIKFVVNGQSYDATFLPEVAQQKRWDQLKTVSILIQKAGYDSTVSQDLLASIVCTRYQSSKCVVSYTDYVIDSCEGKDPIENIVSPITTDNSNKKKLTSTTNRPWPFFNKNR